MSYISVFSTRGCSPPLRKSFILLPCASVIRLVTLTAQAHQVVEVVRLIWPLVRRQYVMHRRRWHDLAFGCTPLTLIVITTQCLRSQPQPSTTLVVHAYHLQFPRIRKPGQAFARSGKEGMGFVERNQQCYLSALSLSITISQVSSIMFNHLLSFSIIYYHLLSFTITIKQSLNQYGQRLLAFLISASLFHPSALFNDLFQPVLPSGSHLLSAVCTHGFLNSQATLRSGADACA